MKLSLRGRRWLFLGAGLLLLLLVTFLRPSDEVREPRAEPRLPRAMSSEEWRRAQRRNTLPEVPPAPPPAPGLPPPRPRPRDPLLAAFPTEVKHGAVVIEANAIRHSEVGELMIDCLFAQGDATLDHMRDAGFDPLVDLDRIAMVDDTVLVSGNFGRTRWDRLNVASERAPFGENGQLGAALRADGGTIGSLGFWGDSLLIMGQSEADVRRALERIEGQSEVQGPPLLDSNRTYGEVYGVFQSDALASQLESEDPAMARLLRAAARQVELHIDVSNDVGLVASFDGNDQEATQDLRKALGAAIALGRLKAETDGNARLAELLGMARVKSAGPGHGSFRLEAGLSHDFLERELRTCAERRRARRSARGADAGGL